MENNKKKIFVIVPPASGHVNPMCGLLNELCKRNDLEIIVFNDDEYRELIEKTGARFRRYSHPTFRLFVKTLSKNVENNIEDMMDYSITLAHNLLPQLIEEIQKDQPDLIIYDNLFLPAKYLMEILKQHYLQNKLSKMPKSVMFAPNFPMTFDILDSLPKKSFLNVSFLLMIVRIWLRNIFLCWKYGIKAYRVEEMFVRKDEQLNLVGVIPQLDYNRDKMDTTYKYVGPMIAYQTRNEAEKLDDKLKLILNEFETSEDRKNDQDDSNSLKLIYVSLGSVLYTYINVFDKIIESIREFNSKSSRTMNSSRFRIVISVGQSLKEFNERIANGELILPGNILLSSYVPQLRVLEKADLFITHCGMNSTNEAIKYAVPIIGIPIGNDQPEVAKRVCDINSIGIKLSLDQLDADRIADAIEQVLTDSIYKTNAKKLSEISSHYDGCVMGAKIILEHLDSGNSDTATDKKLN